MKDPRIEKLAKNLLTYSVDLKENENILIEILGEEGLPLAKELVRQAENMKARTPVRHNVMFDINKKEGKHNDK